MEDNKQEIEIKKLSDDDFRENLERFHGKSYTEDELREEFDIVSIAYGGILCSKRDSDDLVLFNKALSPASNEVFFVKMGGF